jgi:cellulose synthase/poly-beta-1,6-N-acetylglucosamine synthase-like glycosyltransferase
LRFLTAIVTVSIAFFGGFYLLYLIVCALALRTRKTETRREISAVSEECPPAVSMIIPVHNEAKIVGKRMKNLQSINYPKNRLEIIFVDGGSTDGTADLIESSARTAGLSVIVIRQGARRGFNSAVIEGLNEAEGEIVCITGAEAEFEPEALNFLVKHFRDHKIGAVTGRQRIKNIHEGFSPRLEAAYRNLYDFIREAEGCMDSPFDIKGEICAVRRVVYDHLMEKSELVVKGCIDACCSFQARMDGYKTLYEPRAVYYELSARSFTDSFEQHTRRAATLIQNMLVFKNMIFRREFGKFGMIIMPAHFIMLLILPFLFLTGMIGAIASVMLNPTDVLSLSVTIVGALAAIVSSELQAFLKTQFVLVAAVMRLVVGIDTQKFKRLETVRP